MDNDITVDKFNAEIEAAFQKAWHSEKGGDAEWNAFLASYGIAPLNDTEKHVLLNSGMKIVRGAFPVELRKVFVLIKEKYKSLDAGNAFDIDAKVKEYYMKIKPFSGLSDIFKNAGTGTAKYSSGLQAAKQKTITCRNCGAPRLEEMQYDSCMFCGSKLFETKT